MPYSPNACFERFCVEKVNVDPDRSRVAKRSRCNLIENIERLSEAGAVSKLYSDKHIAYGSFSRKTKIEKIDDIDLMIAMHGQGGNYQEIQHNVRYRINMPVETPILGELMEDEGLNSRKVIENFKNNLSGLKDYRKADLHRNQEAVTLQLSSYEWNFDIVPCFYTTEGFYLIPDGNGAWKPSNPKVDQENVTQANQNYDGQLLKLIRVMKYWKKIKRISTMSSYAFEVMIINYAKGRYFINFPEAVCGALRYISTNALGRINDPKCFQGDLNEAGLMEKYDIVLKAQQDAEVASSAIQAEAMKNNALAIAYWQQIFGDGFPRYGE